MAKLEIKGDSKTPFGTTFILDGNELKDLLSVELSFDVDRLNEAKITFMVDEIKVDTDVLVKLKAILQEDKKFKFNTGQTGKVKEYSQSVSS